MPPQCPPPWRALWDAPANRWIYVNEQTGQRQFEFPQGGYGGGGGGGGYPQQQGGYGGGGYPQQGAYQQGGGYGGGGYQQGPPPQQQHQKSSGPGWGGAALGVAAGLAGGMFLEHEGHEIKDDFRRDEYRAEEDVDGAGRYVERKFDNGINDVEDFPEDAARWTGEKVQEVEDIPEDIEGGFDRFAQGVEDVPEDVAGFVGNTVGAVDRFGDNMDNAYDQGRDEGRDDGW